MGLKRYLLLILSFISCSDGGDSIAPSIINKVESSTINGDVPQGLTGRVKLDNIEDIDLEVWVIDHTSPRMERFQVAPLGSFKIPLNFFHQGRVYSIHIIQNFRWLVSLAFGSKESPNELIKYTGGDSFDLGEIVIPVDSYLFPKSGQQVLLSSLGGGFTLDEGISSRSFLSFPSYTGILNFDIGPSLRVTNPNILLYSFILSESNQERYRSNLNTSTQIVVKMQTEEPDQYKDVSLADAVEPILKSSIVNEKLASSPDFWQLSSFMLDKNGSEYSKRIYIGKSLSNLSTIVLRLLPKLGPVRFLPVVLQDQILLPPFIQAIASGEGNLDAKINFSDSLSRNGLTLPFCIEPKMTLRIAYPKITSHRKDYPLNLLKIAISYLLPLPHEIQDLIPLPEDFPETYREDRTISGEPSWSPLKRTLTYDLPKNSQDFIDISLPDAIFLPSIRGKEVFETRIEAIFGSSQNTIEASGIARFASKCGSK